MLEFKAKKMRVGKILPASTLPALGRAIHVQNVNQPQSDDLSELLIGFGKRDTCYPYTEQNLYEEETEQEINIAVLENAFLYAEFLPDLGGRLWKLYDKKNKRDLLYTNDVIRFRNLALRNAWFSGGVEWNIGVIGHCAHTCERMYTAKLQTDEGQDVLRFYEFERVREIFYQIDFWLNEDKLMMRCRIENPNDAIVPMYWWSNIATPEFDGGRIIVDAKRAFSNSDGRGITSNKIPYVNGVDVSHYKQIKDTVDYFFDIKNENNKFIVNVNREGAGLLQVSSSRLKGRKLFSWGHTAGSNNWQKMLTDQAGDYIEIQAGLAKTQYECIPMPANTVWEWVECYTGIESDFSGKDFFQAAKDVNGYLKTNRLDSQSLDAVCDQTAYISRKKAEPIYCGSGFGYLKNMAQNNAPKHLPFFKDATSNKYERLLAGKDFSSAYEDQNSFISEKYLIEALRKLADGGCKNWNVYYLLSAFYASEKEYQKAKEFCETSLLKDNNYFNNHLCAFILLRLGDAGAFCYSQNAIRIKNTDYALAESLISAHLYEKQYAHARKLYHMLSKDLQQNHRLKMYFALCLLKEGDAAFAERILTEEGGLILRDYREGDKMLHELYVGIRMQRYHEKRDAIKVPKQFNFIVVESPAIEEI